MGHRVVLIIAALAVVAAGCGSSGRSTEVPPIPDRVVGTTPVPDAFAIRECRVSVGSGFGAEVVSVDGSTPAAAVLQAGDVILEADGAETPTQADLVDKIRARSIGDVIAVRVARPGTETFDAGVELVEHFDAPGSPMMGVTIRTAVDLRAVSQASDETPGGELVRVVSIEGSLYAVDALAGVWSNLGGATPVDPWAAVGGSVYALTEGEPDTIVDVTGGRAEMTFEVPGWDGHWVLGSQDGLLLVYADRRSDTEIDTAVFAIDPDDGQVVWTWTPAPPDQGQARVPVLAVSDPSRQRTLVATADIDGSGNTNAFSFVLLDRNGSQMSIALPPGGALPQNSQAIGWHDDIRVAYLQAAEEQVVLWNTVTGDVEELALPNTANASQVVPIGDGAHFMVVSESRIDLITGGTAPNITPLAVDCLTDQVSITGLVS